MIDTANWDWDTGEKKVAVGSWSDEFRWVEEYQVSPDGEKVAAIVNIDEGEFNVCANGETWENSCDKIWHLRYTADGRLTALVSEMGEWTVAVDGTAWESRFGYVWNPIYSADGKHVAGAAQQDMQYCMVLDGEAWDKSYSNMTYFALSPCGTKTAAAVQVAPDDVLARVDAELAAACHATNQLSIEAYVRAAEATNETTGTVLSGKAVSSLLPSAMSHSSGIPFGTGMPPSVKRSSLVPAAISHSSGMLFALQSALVPPMMSSASSQEIFSNRPSPFSPTRFMMSLTVIMPFSM